MTRADRTPDEGWPSQWPSQGRFVFLEHRMPVGSDRPDHWDLMFETQHDLWTFASVPLGPGSRWFLLQPLPRHRLTYLDYEGPISQNRGCVRRVAGGHFVTVDRLREGVTVELQSLEFRGHLRLIGPTESDPLVGECSQPTADDWRACWEPFPVTG